MMTAKVNLGERCVKFQLRLFVNTYSPRQIPGECKHSPSIPQPMVDFSAATFVYDGNGSMVKSTVNEITTYYIGGYYELKVDGTTETETETKYYSGPTDYQYTGQRSYMDSEPMLCIGFGANEHSSFARLKHDNVSYHYYVARWYDPDPKQRFRSGTESLRQHIFAQTDSGRMLPFALKRLNRVQSLIIPPARQLR